jgi:hypothetical protein
MNRILRTGWAGLLITLSLWMLAAQPVTAQVNSGSLRVVNALPGIGPVDIFLDNQRIAFALPPFGATPYFAVAAGRHALAVRPVGADAFSAPIADLLVDLAPNGSQTAVVYQRLFAAENSPPIPVEQSSAIFIVEDDRSPIQLGRSRLTAVHLAVGAPEVVSLGYPSGESLMPQIGFAQPYGTIDLDAGEYSLAVNDATNPTTSIERIGNQNLYANTLYTAIIVPNVTPASQDGVVGTGSAQTRTLVLSAPLEAPVDGVRLRLVHAAHDAAVVDIYIDERLVASRVNYGDYTEYLGLASYSHVVTVRRFGDSAQMPPLGQGRFTITPENQDQRDWTLLLVNASLQGDPELQATLFASATQIANTLEAEPDPNQPVLINIPDAAVQMSLLLDDISSTATGLARIRVMNAATGAPPLGVYTPFYPVSQPVLPAGSEATPIPAPDPAPLPGLQITSATNFAAIATSGEVPVGLYNELNFITTGSTTPLFTLRNLQLVSGVVYSLVVIGSPTGNPPVDVLVLQDFGLGASRTFDYIGVIATAADSIRVRQDPSPNGGILASVTNGAEVQVLGRDSSSRWVRIRFFNVSTGQAQEGWVSGTDNIIAVTRQGVPVRIAELPEYLSR